jgi:hypothetical protein
VTLSLPDPDLNRRIDGCDRRNDRLPPVLRDGPQDAARTHLDRHREAAVRRASIGPLIGKA